MRLSLPYRRDDGVEFSSKCVRQPLPERRIYRLECAEIGYSGAVLA
jgi:hypothetical protein